MEHLGVSDHIAPSFPGGPYSAFAGRDASRGLATFEVQKVSDDHDDLSDLKPSELDQVGWPTSWNYLDRNLLKSRDSSLLLVSIFHRLLLSNVAHLGKSEQLVPNGYWIEGIEQKNNRITDYKRMKRIEEKRTVLLAIVHPDLES